MKKYIIGGLILTTLLTGCTKEEAPIDVKEDSVTGSTLKVKLVWYDNTLDSPRLILREDTEGKYKNIGSEKVSVTIDTTINKDLVSKDTLLYDGDYEVKFKDEEITEIKQINADEDIWKSYLTNGKYNIILLQGLEANLELNTLMNTLSEEIPNTNIIYDNNTMKSIRDYSKNGVEVGESCIVIYNGYNYLGTIRTKEDYKKLIDKL